VKDAFTQWHGTKDRAAGLDFNPAVFVAPVQPGVELE
jgi:L-rhamnose isomerase